MLVIRMQKVGRKHEPVYRLVLTESKNGPQSGKYLEVLGNFDSRRSEKAEFNVDRIKHWIAQGVKTSDTVHNLLVDKKIIEGKKINVLPRKSPIIAKATEKLSEEPKTTSEIKPQPSSEAVNEDVKSETGSSVDSTQPEEKETPVEASVETTQQISREVAGEKIS